jgi:hypothetical protein
MEDIASIPRAAWGVSIAFLYKNSYVSSLFSSIKSIKTNEKIIFYIYISFWDCFTFEKSTNSRLCQ